LAFEPEAVLKLIEADRDVIGCAYPHRALPMTKRLEDVLETESVGEWLSRHTDYAIRNPSGDIDRGIVEVTRIGVGLLLISKAALETLVRGEQAFEYRFNGEVKWFSQERYYGFLDYMTVDRLLLTEDYSFCERWRRAGGHVYAVLSETISHVVMWR
jgi:hypothetical protein